MTRASEPVIRVEGLSKRYRIGERVARYRTLRESLTGALRRPFGRRAADGADLVWALRDVSFEVPRGEILGVIGRNGAGKSTLLKVLSGITCPTEGTVRIHGRVVSLLEVGTGFHPELTGRENVYLNGAILGMRRAEMDRRFDDIVAFAQVERFVDTPVKHYSSGMYFRLAFAVAAHLSPEVVLVDEVLAVGDAEFQRKCLGKMGEAARQARTVLFVSHNMGAISAFCHRVVYLANGRVRAIGTPDAIVAQYLADVFGDDRTDLAELRGAGYGRTLRFTAIDLAADDGANVAFGAPLRFRVTLRSDVSAQELSLGASVFSVTGTCVGTLFTRERFAMAPGEARTFSLTLAGARLAPGSYYASVSVGHGGRDGGRLDFDLVVGRPAFHVLPMSPSGEAIADWNPAWGAIVFEDTRLQAEPG